MSHKQPKTVKPPVVSQTSLGYQYVRCRCGDDDATAYVHQLCAIAGGADPYDVFSDRYDVHHLPLGEWLDLDADAPPTPLTVGDLVVPAVDAPGAVDLVPRWEHRQANLSEADS